MKLSPSEQGYMRIGLQWGNRFLVHRLVAEAFLGTQDELLQVNHKNGVKSDNSVENLEWVSPSDNMKHAWRTGLFVRKPTRGEQVKQSDLKEQDILDIRKAYKLGGFSQSQLGRLYGVSKTNIRQIVKRRIWTHV